MSKPLKRIVIEEGCTLKFKGKVRFQPASAVFEDAKEGELLSFKLPTKKSEGEPRG